jgi:hypothetical protein
MTPSLLPARSLAAGTSLRWYGPGAAAGSLISFGSVHGPGSLRLCGALLCFRLASVYGALTPASRSLFLSLSTTKNSLIEHGTLTIYGSFRPYVPLYRRWLVRSIWRSSLRVPRYRPAVLSNSSVSITIYGALSHHVSFGLRGTFILHDSLVKREAIMFYGSLRERGALHPLWLVRYARCSSFAMTRYGSLALSHPI